MSFIMRRFLGLLVLLALLAGGGWLWWVFYRPAGPTHEVFVDIAPGTTARGIARELKRSGIIASPLGFEALGMVRGGSLKAGEYRFDHPERLTDVYRTIARGEVYTIGLAIPEGANLFDIAARVQAAKLGAGEGFLEAARRHTELIADLDPHAQSLEGFLFPSTYRFSRHATPVQMLGAMVRQFRVEAAALGMAGDMHRTVTLASLVERETPVPAERPLVASVFANRLAQGMPLDTDPTVIYAALLKGNYRGSIFRSDLNADSPYNTYRHTGLPPGPICNPGVISLRAALHPAHTDYLYFVAAGADPHGRSRFSSTLAQHLKNVAAYREAVRSGAAQ